MQLPYFFEPSISAINSVVVLDEDTSRHCIQVLRMKEGGKLQLTNGKGGLYTAVIVQADKKRCSVRIEESSYTSPEKRTICLAVSLLKNANRWEWFLEKAVEMGVHEIIPLLCERTERQQYKKERAQNIAVSAMLQSRQVWLPHLYPPTTFGEAMHRGRSFPQKLIAHCRDDADKAALQTLPKEESVQIMIGPEGDFAEQEISLALQNGYLPVHLGSTRLRTETAGVVASALLIHYHK